MNTTTWEQIFDKWLFTRVDSDRSKVESESKLYEDFAEAVEAANLPACPLESFTQLLADNWYPSESGAVIGLMLLSDEDEGAALDRLRAPQSPDL